MCEKDYLHIRSKSYETIASRYKGKEASNPNATSLLHMENPSNDTLQRIPKGVIKKVVYDPNSRDTQNYSIMEYVAQATCAMSTLEVLQSCLTK